MLYRPERSQLVGALDDLRGSVGLWEGMKQTGIYRTLLAAGRNDQISGKGLEKSMLLVNGISEAEDRVVRNEGDTYECSQAEGTKLGIPRGC